MMDGGLLSVRYVNVESLPTEGEAQVKLNNHIIQIIRRVGRAKSNLDQCKASHRDASSASRAVKER